MSITELIESAYLPSMGFSDYWFFFHLSNALIVQWQIEKMPAEDIKKELRVAGIPSDAVEGILHALSLRSLSELEGL